MLTAILIICIGCNRETPDRQSNETQKPSPQEARVISVLGKFKIKSIGLAQLQGCGLSLEQIKTMIDSIKAKGETASILVKACREVPNGVPTLLYFEQPIKIFDIKKELGKSDGESLSSPPAQTGLGFITWYRYGTVDLGLVGSWVEVIRVRPLD